MGMSFRIKVEETFSHSGRDCFNDGLEALESKDKRLIKKRIRFKDSRKIEGSVYIEKCVEGGRWDYAVGYSEEVYFIEVHSATTPREINNVIEKARWLKEWKSRTPFKDDNRLLWVPSGKVGFLINSPQFRRLTKEGIGFVSSLIPLD